MAIITIGREFGSGGHEIGEKVAQKLGIPFYDKEILTRAAQESGLCPEVFEQHDEKASIGNMLGTAAHMNGVAVGSVGLGVTLPLSQQIFLAQFDAITKIAQDGDCVIVGRCSDYILKDYPNALHVFLYASLEKRIERIMRVRNVTSENARDLIRKTDKQRKNYYNFFANGSWGGRENYSIMLSTDHLTTDQAAELIIACAAAYAGNKEAF